MIVNSAYMKAKPVKDGEIHLTLEEYIGFLKWLQPEERILPSKFRSNLIQLTYEPNNQH